MRLPLLLVLLLCALPFLPTAQAEHVIVDINVEQYVALRDNNIKVGEIFFNCGRNEISGSDRVSIENFAGGYESTYLNLPSSSLGDIDEIGFYVEWNKDSAGRLDVTVTPPSGISETLSTRPINWFDTIVIELLANIGMGQHTLRSNTLNTNSFRNLNVTGFPFDADSQDDAFDSIMIRLNDYDSNNQPSLNLSTIFRAETTFWGRASELRIMFLQTEANPEDVDGDDLPDWWETEHFAESVAIEPDALCSNSLNTVRQAYIAGLDPNDPADFFKLSLLGNRLWWNATSGRVYNIWSTTNLLTGFEPFVTNYTGSSYTDTVHTAEQSLFYKIDVELQ